MNLLENLKNGRFFRKSAVGSGLLFTSFLFGAALFYFFGTAAYFCLENSLSNFAFCILYTSLFAVIYISAFSQLGIFPICISYAAFTFAVMLFSVVRMLLLPSVLLKPMLVLCVQEFLLIFFTLVISQKAVAISAQLLKRTASDKKFFAALSANGIVFLALWILLLVICFTAF